MLAGVCYAGVFLLNKFPGGDPLWATILGQCLGAVIGLPSLVRAPQLGAHAALLFAVILGGFQLGLAYVCVSARCAAGACRRGAELLGLRQRAARPLQKGQAPPDRL